MDQLQSARNLGMNADLNALVLNLTQCLQLVFAQIGIMFHRCPLVGGSVGLQIRIGVVFARLWEQFTIPKHIHARIILGHILG